MNDLYGEGTLFVDISVLSSKKVGDAISEMYWWMSVDTFVKVFLC